MLLENEQDIIQLIQKDEWMMDILYKVKLLNLPDWWVCAGFVRSKIWDTLHGFDKRTLIPDVDVIYFDKHNIDERIEKELELKLLALNPDIPWSVKNEARMHLVNDFEPYINSEDAMSKFPETATALGVKLDDYNNVILTAPLGIEDVINLVIKPSPFIKETKERLTIYEHRIYKKNWKATWPRVQVFYQ